MKSLLTCLVVWLAAATSSCATVEFYERAALQDPTMAFSAHPAETHFHQKAFYSQEGSAGGIGTTAGGGCGCY